MSRNVTPKKRKSTAERIIEALKVSHGLIDPTAEAAGCSPRTVHRYVKDSPAVAEALEDAREELYDLVESKIYEKIKQGDTTMLIFFAKTRMKHRGYTEKQAEEAPKDIEIRVVYSDEVKRDERRARAPANTSKVYKPQQAYTASDGEAAGVSDSRRI